MSKLVILKTRVREKMRDDVAAVADRHEQSIADVLRRYVREGLERDARRNGKESP